MPFDACPAPIHLLDDALLHAVLSRLGPHALAAAAATCRRWRAVTEAPAPSTSACSASPAPRPGPPLSLSLWEALLRRVEAPGARHAASWAACGGRASTYLGWRLGWTAASAGEALVVDVAPGPAAEPGPGLATLPPPAGAGAGAGTTQRHRLRPGGPGAADSGSGAPPAHLSQPTWSPGGRLLAASAVERNAGAYAPPAAFIVVNRRDGSPALRIRLRDGCPPFFFAWSACGCYLAALSNWAGHRVALRVLDVAAALGPAAAPPRLAHVGTAVPLYVSWCPAAPRLYVHAGHGAWAVWGAAAGTFHDCTRPALEGHAQGEEEGEGEEQGAAGVWWVGPGPAAMGPEPQWRTLLRTPPAHQALMTCAPEWGPAAAGGAGGGAGGEAGWLLLPLPLATLRALQEAAGDAGEAAGGGGGGAQAGPLRLALGPAAMRALSEAGERGGGQRIGAHGRRGGEGYALLALDATALDRPMGQAALLALVNARPGAPGAGPGGAAAGGAGDSSDDEDEETAELLTAVSPGGEMLAWALGPSVYCTQITEQLKCLTAGGKPSAQAHAAGGAAAGRLGAAASDAAAGGGGAVWRLWPLPPAPWGLAGVEAASTAADVVGMQWAPCGRRLLVLVGEPLSMPRMPLMHCCVVDFGADHPAPAACVASAAAQGPSCRTPHQQPPLHPRLRPVRFHAADEPAAPPTSFVSRYVPFLDTYLCGPCPPLQLWAPDGRAFCFYPRAARVKQGCAPAALYHLHSPGRGAAAAPDSPQAEGGGGRARGAPRTPGSGAAGSSTPGLGCDGSGGGSGGGSGQRDAPTPGGEARGGSAVLAGAGAAPAVATAGDAAVREAGMSNAALTSDHAEGPDEDGVGEEGQGATGAVGQVPEMGGAVEVARLRVGERLPFRVFHASFAPGGDCSG